MVARACLLGLLCLASGCPLVAAAAVPAGELVTFPAELPDAGGVAVVVRYGQRPGQVVLHFVPDPQRPVAMALPEGGESSGVSGPVVVAADQPLTATAVRYAAAGAIDPRRGSGQPISAEIDLARGGRIPEGPVPLTLIVAYTIPGEGLVVRRALDLPLPAAWLPPR